jgi:autotransporter strand-loop-strand O-heptosyltransferase
MKPKVFAHVPYIGTTGYNNHTRDFFRSLSKYIDIKIRNYTVGKSWDGLNDEPHNNEFYLDDLDKKLLHQQTLWSDNQHRKDYKIYTQHGNDFDHNVNLILNETNHYYFYDGYVGPKIGYNVWESTRQPEGFFETWDTFDQMWVPSKWQAKCTIEQGADPNKIKVVPEGVDTNTFYPEDPVTKLDYTDGRFKFILFGRWDYRKSTKEIIETFLKTFDPSEPVDLILSIDNPWGHMLDKYNSTEERLKAHNLEDSRLKIKHFPSREDYITYLKNGHVFLSCARAEGWNLPLIEAMACGTPSIYSNCSGQLEFAQGKGLPVKIVGERPASDNYYGNFGVNLKDNFISGNYYEPDFEDLARVMRDAFENYTDHKKRALEEAKLIHRDFNWNKVAEIGRDTLQEFLINYNPNEIKSNKIKITYLDGPKVEILGNEDNKYNIEFIDGDTNQVIYETTINNNMWTTCDRKYYTNWVIKINGEIVDKFDLTDKRVLICLESKSIGDTIAWTPYVIEFAKKHNCKVVVSTFHNKWFKDLDAYKDIEFIEPGNSTNCHVVYKIGWFKSDKGKWDKFSMYPNQVNIIPLQQTATDILGLEYKELNYGLNFTKKSTPFKEKYIVIGPQSTSGCKEWDYVYWGELSSKLIDSGYKVISLTKGFTYIPNVDNYSDQSFEDIANYLLNAELFIGLGSGLSWFNWALGKHTVMINGFSDKNHEFVTNITRVINEDSCISCWTNPNFVFDAGDWNWCPAWKGTSKQFICQKSITPEQVFNLLPL